MAIGQLADYVRLVKPSPQKACSFPRSPVLIYVLFSQERT